MLRYLKFGAAGVVGSTSDNRLAERTTPSVPFNGGFAAFLELGTFTPPFPRKGIRFSCDLPVSGRQLLGHDPPLQWWGFWYKVTSSVQRTNVDERNNNGLS